MKKLHICLNMQGGDNWMGGAIYIQNLARAIASLHSSDRETVYLSIACNSDNLTLVEPIRDCVDRVFVNGSDYLKISQRLMEYLPFIPFHLFNPLEIDFLYPTYASLQVPYSWGAWIPDFQHIHLPELFDQATINMRDSHHAKLADTAPVTILSSQMAQSDFNHLYPHAVSRAKVLNFASYIESEWYELEPKLVQLKYELPDVFFLVCNQFWKHKNHLLIIKALEILKVKNIYPMVVFTGNYKDENNLKYFNEISSEVESSDLSNQIKFLGLIPRSDQIQLMRRSLSVIQPSLFEGWSTVVEDAKALGKHILISDFPVHIEQCSSGFHFFEKQSSSQLAELMVFAIDNFNPGPDIDGERKSKEKIQQKIINCGKNFVKIVKNVIEGDDS
jgi:glycosyltransferase involved in cell wall biosynthesis